ncbi:MAG: hypothetical protein LBH61_04040, partial [Dysgonamonadaceae bacterium]|nr:hypothetical protein [Dysgonamonadaceae bacterium]
MSFIILEGGAAGHAVSFIILKKYNEVAAHRDTASQKYKSACGAVSLLFYKLIDIPFAAGKSRDDI